MLIASACIVILLLTSLAVILVRRSRRNAVRAAISQQEIPQQVPIGNAQDPSPVVSSPAQPTSGGFNATSAVSPLPAPSPEHIAKHYCTNCGRLAESPHGSAQTTANSWTDMSANAVYRASATGLDCATPHASLQPDDNRMTYCGTAADFGRFWRGIPQALSHVICTES